LRLLRQHAMSLSDQHRHAADKVLIEEYPEVGFNYRMTDLQAAIGVEQMKRLDGILVRRRQLAERYTRLLAGIPGIEPPFVPEYATPNYQSYAVRLGDGFPLSRNDLMEFLLGRGIAARRGIMTSHREKPYPGHQLPITDRASDQSLLLPLYPTMTEAEQDRVVAALEDSHAARRAA
jgi:perosamine synthetase